MVKLVTHASEAGHWYDVTGKPVYEVQAANGSPRPTTLRDARKLNLCPSVTGIIRCAAAPGLEKWKAEQLLLAALTLPRRQDEPESDWLDRVRTDSQEQARNAAERGTAIHAAIQGYYEGKPVPDEYRPHVQGAVKAINEWHKSWPIWGGKEPEFAGMEAEQSFAHPSGFGGKTDLFGHAPGWVLDFKSKEFGPDTKLQTWDEHAMQLSAYREGLNLPKAVGAICYVSATVPGLAKVMVIGEPELQQGWEMFRSLLFYWQAKNNYRPDFDRVAE